jgi:hypothetical protein
MRRGCHAGWGCHDIKAGWTQEDTDRATEGESKRAAGWLLTGLQPGQ